VFIYTSNERNGRLQRYYYHPIVESIESVVAYVLCSYVLLHIVTERNRELGLFIARRRISKNNIKPFPLHWFDRNIIFDLDMLLVLDRSWKFEFLKTQNTVIKINAVSTRSRRYDYAVMGFREAMTVYRAHIRVYKYHSDVVRKYDINLNRNGYKRAKNISLTLAKNHDAPSEYENSTRCRLVSKPSHSGNVALPYTDFQSKEQMTRGGFFFARDSDRGDRFDSAKKESRRNAGDSPNDRTRRRT